MFQLYALLITRVSINNEVEARNDYLIYRHINKTNKLNNFVEMWNFTDDTEYYNYQHHNLRFNIHIHTVYCMHGWDTEQ